MITLQWHSNLRDDELLFPSRSQASSCFINPSLVAEEIEVDVCSFRAESILRSLATSDWHALKSVISFAIYLQFHLHYVKISFSGNNRHKGESSKDLHFGFHQLGKTEALASPVWYAEAVLRLSAKDKETRVSLSDLDCDSFHFLEPRPNLLLFTVQLR